MQIVLTSCCVHEGKLEITKLNFQKFESWLLFYGEESRFSYFSKIWPLCDPFLSLDLNKCWAEEAGVSAWWEVRSLWPTSVMLCWQPPSPAPVMRSKYANKEKRVSSWVQNIISNWLYHFYNVLLYKCVSNAPPVQNGLDHFTNKESLFLCSDF